MRRFPLNLNIDPAEVDETVAMSPLPTRSACIAHAQCNFLPAIGLRLPSCLHRQPSARKML